MSQEAVVIKVRKDCLGHPFPLRTKEHWCSRPSQQKPNKALGAEVHSTRRHNMINLINAAVSLLVVVGLIKIVLRDRSKVTYRDK